MLHGYYYPFDSDRKYIKKGYRLIELLKTILRFYESHTVHESMACDEKV